MSELSTSQFFQAFGVGDLALGKPPLYWLHSKSTAREAMEALRELNLTEISIWGSNSTCIGCVNNLDIICFLASCLTESMSVDEALEHPISALLPPIASNIKHVDPGTRLTKILELAAGGVQYVVVPFSKASSLPQQTASSRWARKDHCWISQEAVTRFMMGCISAFCPQSLFSIDELGIINPEFMFLPQHAKMSSHLHLLRKASESMTAVALIDDHDDYDDDEDDEEVDGKRSNLKLIGDISPSSLRNCEEHLTAIALATLTAADFLSCLQDSRRGSRHFLKSIKSRILEVEDERHALSRTLDEAASDQSDSEHDPFSAGWHRSGGSSCLTCKPWSSLVAVMAQALAHRSRYIWVTDSDDSLVGIVTYADILGVLVKKLHSDRGRIGSSQKLFSSTPKGTRYT